VAVEVEDRDRCLAGCELSAVAEVDHGASELCSLARCVEAFERGWDEFFGAIEVVVFCCFEEWLEFGCAEGGQRYDEREVDVG
jgi:hypothetical protein